VAGWVGMGKDNYPNRTDHVARPLSTLKDPASFGPPPKRVISQAPVAVINRAPSERRNLGAGPLSSRQTRQPSSTRRSPTEGAEAASPLSYRPDRTGLSTSSPPPPPFRHIESSGHSNPGDGSKLKPSLPPRLPPRRDSGVSHPPSPPPPYAETESHGQLNQGAISRLGEAGISVPSLGIGRALVQRDSNSGSRSPVDGPAANTSLNELQTRFSKISTSTALGSPSSSAQGTTLAEKQAALRTVQNFHGDPSSVSVADARNAASTANNLRERHGDQIEAGKKKFTALNQRYGITKRINEFIGDQNAPAEPEPQQVQGQPPPPPPHPLLNRTTSNIDIEALNKRKPPPPPAPPKNPQIQSTPGHALSAPPPPLPLETKPR
jgi:hypothetical protein